MPIETQYLDDFSGGEINHVSSLEFAKNQWWSLNGFVFDNQRRLRSQWAGSYWDIDNIEIDDVSGPEPESFIPERGVEDIGVLNDFVVALSKDGVWSRSERDPGLGQPEWVEIVGLPDDAATLRFSGVIPLLVDEVWVNAALLNSASSGSEAAAIYLDPYTEYTTVKTWDNRFPTDITEGTPDSMPRAAVAANWGDYVILGDINWKANPAEPYSSTNTARYPHGIWRSVAGTSDRWDPDDVFFIGQKSDENAVLGMFPMDAGLLVVTQSIVAMLRGTPDDFLYEELRNGISPRRPEEVCFWPYAGLVVWIDRFGRVWATNGEAVSRIDRNVTIEYRNEGCVLAVDEALLVSGGADVRMFFSFGESGGWTTLQTPSGWGQAAALGTLIIGVGANQNSGDFILDDDVFGILSPNDGYEARLHGSVDTIQVFDWKNEDERGTFAGYMVRPLLRTQPLPGGSDKVVFWHRYGVRAKGNGRLLRTTAYGSYDVRERGLVARPRAHISRRSDWMFPAHGPSLEAVFEFEFEGDVTVEHLTLLAHRGRDSR